MEGCPGPGGTRIYPKRPRGRTRGVPATEAEADAARVAALKHGGRASIVSAQEARGLALERKFGKGSREVLDAYHAAISDGDTSGTDALAERGLANLEMIRRDMVSKVAKQGSVLKEGIVSPSTGEILGERVRVHPAVEPVAKFSELLGFVSSARRLDPKSRGEGARDEALTRLMQRDRLLRGMSKEAMAPPPDDNVIDAELVRNEPEA